ncbi:MAG: protein translocase SEC61 complex subunit gamma [Thermoplasmata archaeon]
MDILEESWKIQGRVEERFKRIGKGSLGRILKMARKPTSEEYKKTTLVCSAGMVLVGGAGFLIYFLMKKAPELFYWIFGP